MFGQAVGALVQLAISYLLLFEDGCDGVRCARDLLFEQLVNAFVLRILGLGRVPFHEQLAPFACC